MVGADRGVDAVVLAVLISVFRAVVFCLAVRVGVLSFKSPIKHNNEAHNFNNKFT